MLDLSCLDRVAEGPALLSTGLLFTSTVLLWLGLVAAALAAPLVRRAYRKRVVRLMRFDQVSERPQQWRQSATRGVVQRDETQGRVEFRKGLVSLVSLVEARERRICKSTVMAWLVFVLAGLPIAYSLQPEGPWADQALFAFGAGLLGLGPAYVNFPERFARRALLAGVLACLVPMLLVALVFDSSLTTQTVPSDPESPDLFVTVSGVAIAGFTYLTMFHRTLRGVVLPAAVVLAVALLLCLLPIGYLEPYMGNCVFEATRPGNLQLKLPLTAIVGTLLTVTLWLGFKALNQLASLVQAGWLSELSLMGVISVPLIAMSMVAGALTDRPAPSAWLAWLPLLWSLVTFSTYAITLGRPVISRGGPPLLVLRVFAKDRKQIRLLDQLQSRWRYAGPVHQIGGPDLATMNIDPYESALFLVGRLHDAFLPSVATAEQLSSRLSDLLDREGRYRINEAFCFNSAWRATVEQLMRVSAAIVVDLRGFSNDRDGTGYELRVLARANLLDRVVAIGDESTDWAHADKIVAGEGQAPCRLRRQSTGQRCSVDDIFKQLLSAAGDVALAED